MSVRRIAVALIVALAAVVVTPSVARGHSAFVSAEPEPGAELGAAPGVVVLRFTEPLNVKLSLATVTVPDGSRFEGAPSVSHEIRVRLSTNAQGVYEVEWKTVSTVDGHTLTGSFRFGVGVSPGAGAEGSSTTAPRPGDLAIAVARAIEYVAILLSLGMLSVGRLASREPRLAWVRPRVASILAMALVGGVAVVLGEALIAAPSPSVGAVVTYLTTGLPGVARLARPLLEAAALVAALRGLRTWAAPLAAAVVTLAAAGHAAASNPRAWAISVDVVHLLAGGVWAGGMLALATFRPPGGWRGPEGRALLERFSPVALTAFVITVGAGVLRGFQEVGGLRDLFASSYGQVLLVKVLGVVVMVQLSALAWRRVLGSFRLEAAVALFVIGAAALLAAYPLPPA
ncbi:MAG: copper resistance protein CopC/CopD, partial [Actinobacteria bacterium]|nr:copper resistance protein CopC/CopD [Actinomycetota bacterium]